MEPLPNWMVEEAIAHQHGARSVPARGGERERERGGRERERERRREEKREGGRGEEGGATGATPGHRDGALPDLAAWPVPEPAPDHTSRSGFLLSMSRRHHFRLARPPASVFSMAVTPVGMHLLLHH